MAVKVRRGGKYPNVVNADGYYGRNEAGNQQEFVPKDAGIKREFIGSDTEEYTFADRVHGTHTITAESYKDALRIAESMGYTASDYKKRPKGKRGKR